MRGLRHTRKTIQSVPQAQAPTYKLATFLAKKKIGDLIKLPKTFVANNSSQVANDLKDQDQQEL